jgi:AcrR family transcriptional regulator
VTETSSDASLAELAARRAVEGRVRASEQEVRRLLDAGLALMTAGGTERPPRIADIVGAAGLSNQAFYRYFAGKDDLVAAIVDDGERRLVGYVQRQLAAGGSDCVEVFVEAVTSQATDPEVAAATRAVLWNASRALDSTGGRTRRLHEQLAAVLTEHLADAGAPDPMRDAAVISAAATSFMLDHLWRQSPPSPDDVEHLLAFCRAGLRR